MNDMTLTDLFPDMVTGAYVRVLRDGRWQSVDIAALTDAELDGYLTTLTDPDRLRQWAYFLARHIRDHAVRETSHA